MVFDAATLTASFWDSGSLEQSHRYLAGLGGGSFEM
jgi:hypothetical protein